MVVNNTLADRCALLEQTLSQLTKRIETVERGIGTVPPGYLPEAARAIVMADEKMREIEEKAQELTGALKKLERLTSPPMGR